MNCIGTIRYETGAGNFVVAFDECRGGQPTWAYKPEALELVVEPAKLPELTMRLGEGLGIILDPNIPFSRKFAEAFLDAIYGAKNA